MLFLCDWEVSITQNASEVTRIALSCRVSHPPKWCSILTLRQVTHCHIDLSYLSGRKSSVPCAVSSTQRTGMGTRFCYVYVGTSVVKCPRLLYQPRCESPSW